MEYPKCPHCKHVFDDEEIYHSGSTDFPTSNDGDETDTTCLACGKELRIQLSLMPEWNFLDEDGSEL